MLASINPMRARKQRSQLCSSILQAQWHSQSCSHTVQCVATRAHLSRDSLHLSEVEEQVHLMLLHVCEGAHANAATRGGCPSRTQVEHRWGPHFCDETAHFSYEVDPGISVSAVGFAARSTGMGDRAM